MDIHAWSDLVPAEHDESGKGAFAEPFEVKANAWVGQHDRLQAFFLEGLDLFGNGVEDVSSHGRVKHQELSLFGLLNSDLQSLLEDRVEGEDVESVFTVLIFATDGAA